MKIQKISICVLYSIIFYACADNNQTTIKNEFDMCCMADMTSDIGSDVADISSDLDTNDHPDLTEIQDASYDFDQNEGGDLVEYSGPKICDINLDLSSDKISFYYYIDEGSRGTAAGRVNTENGVHYFMLDAACNYFIQLRTETNSSWDDIRTGQLTKQELDELQSSLAQVDWDKLNRTIDVEEDLPSHASLRILALENYILGFVCVNCDRHGQAIKRLSNWLESIDMRSTIYEPSSLRLLPLKVNKEDEIRINIPIYDLPIDIDFSTHARSQYEEFICPGDGMLIDDLSTVQLLRTQRAIYMAQYSLPTHGGLPVRDMHGQVYKLIFRSSTPFDGPDGPVLFGRDPEIITRCRFERMLLQP